MSRCAPDEAGDCAGHAVWQPAAFGTQHAAQADPVPFLNPARVRIALAEKGLTGDLTFVSVDVPGGEHRSPAYLEKNPSGLLPALELDDGTFISECTAITEYLDNLDGEPVLTGKTPKQRATIHMMQRRAVAGMKYLDSVLETQPWLAGSDFSMADITAFAGLAFADFAGVDILEDCTSLMAWPNRVAARPSVTAQA